MFDGFDVQDLPWKELADWTFLPASDPLWRRAPTPFIARYNVLGIALEVATNAPALAELAAAAFGDWGEPEAVPDAALVRLELFLHDACEPAPVDARSLLMRIRDGCLLLTTGQSLGFGQRSGGYACAFLTPALLANRPLAQVCFIETLGMYLVCHYRRATLHAAAVCDGGRCALLTGSSGAGKSTLAYACLRAGFGLLAEDVVFAEIEAEAVQVRGVPWALHLLPEAARFFPELAGVEAVRQLNGESKLCLRTRDVRPEAAITRMPVAGILSLGRSGGRTSRLRPADPASVRHALTYFKDDPALDPVAMQAAADRLLAGRVAHLEAGTDLPQAACLVRDWLAAEG
jgi:hypothetical protein